VTVSFPDCKLLSPHEIPQPHTKAPKVKAAISSNEKMPMKRSKLLRVLRSTGLKGKELAVLDVLVLGCHRNLGSMASNGVK